MHDPLHVRAVAFESGEGRAVICLIDAIGIGRETSDLAKSRAAEKTGWQTDHPARNFEEKMVYLAVLLPPPSPRIFRPSYGPVQWHTHKHDQKTSNQTQPLYNGD